MTTIRVLMIDEDASNRALFRRMLRRAGDAKIEFLEEATLAESGDYRAEDLDVVLLDETALRTGMPLQHWLTGSLDLPAVIVLTGASTDGQVTDTAGFFEQLCKNDCTTEELVMAVRYAAQLTRLKRDLARFQAGQRTALRNSLQQPGEVVVSHDHYVLEVNGRLSGLVQDLRRLLNGSSSGELRQIYADTLDACSRFESALRLANQPKLGAHAAPQFHPAMAGDHREADHAVYRRY
jgi:DNA-binding NarL/FixJ family response regulator